VLESAGQSRGGRSISFELYDNTTAGMQLTFGDFIQFDNHDKIYMIVGNTSIDPNDYGGAPTQADPILITPELIKSTSSFPPKPVKINDLSVKVVALGSTNEFKTDQDGYFIFSKEVREVY
jgi:hypothetical protein